MFVTSVNKIIESFRLEQPFKITEFNNYTALPGPTFNQCS